MSKPAPSWIPLALKAAPSAIDRYRQYAGQLRPLSRAETLDSNRLGQLLVEFLDSLGSQPAGHRTALSAAGLLLTDLVAQRWRLRIRQGTVEARSPQGVSPEDQKAMVKRQELVKRDAQLARPSVQSFLEEMERNRRRNDEWVSIYNLMRDGRELAASLQAVPLTTNGHALSLAGVIEPYLQFVSSNARCHHTGLRLVDIWRYFRHTWTNHYASIPGRNLMFLVRDRAAPYHPVIGLGALSSAIMQIRERDLWLGWHPEAVLDELNLHPSAKAAQWLKSIVDGAMKEIYVADLIRDGWVTRYQLDHPRESVIHALRDFGRKSRRMHERFSNRNELKSTRHDRRGTHYWRQRAQTHLFRSKRCLALADLLQARAVLNEFFGQRPSAKALKAMLQTTRGKRAVHAIARKAKADRVGVAIADISVCGAIAPYNALLGGKLVSMLAASPEVIAEYRRRYGGAKSEIASSMAGRAIQRPAELVFLGTTSLYDRQSSQYNRIRVPCEVLGGLEGDWIRFQRLGHSESFGTSHYSEDTVQALVTLVQQTNGGQRVNSIFGEGASPKLRKVREGIELLGFPADALLQHGRRRIVYGVPLIKNLREYLLGIHKRPQYLIARAQQGTEAIVDWWLHRWARKRLGPDRPIAEIQAHSHVRPIRHGARVDRPAGEEQCAAE